MSNITITIDTGNAAFSDDDLGGEIARILHKLADEFEDESRNAIADMEGHGIMDVNGNSVGRINLQGIESDWAHVEDYTSNMSREHCVEVLESISIQHFDHESVAELREAVEANIKDGTLDFDDVRGCHDGR